MTANAAADDSARFDEGARQRLLVFALAATALSLAGVVARSIFVAATGRFDVFLEASFLVHLVAWIPMLGLWVFARGGKGSPRTHHAVESAASISCAGLHTAVLLPLDPHPVFALILLAGTADGALIRASYLPSSVRRHALVTLGMGIPLLLLAVYYAPEYSDFVGHSQAATGLAGVSPGAVVVAFLVLWGLTVAAGAIAAKIVHGLRHELREAQKLGQYTLEYRLGAGGMGEVFRARHGMLRRPAAIKILRSNEDTQAAVARFEHEVQRTAELTHPNTVRVFDYGRTQEGLFYYAMELLDGADLQRIVRVDGPQPPGRVVRILKMVAAALGEAHAINLIHRDIKPANIILCSQGGELDVAKVVDFGLVRHLEQESAPRSQGTIAGSPAYMAPECIVNAASDARSDIYALGAVAYYLLTGASVFSGTPMEVLVKHINEAPVDPSTRTGKPIDERLEAFVMDCLAKDANLRPQNTREVIERLTATSVEPWTQEAARMWWNVFGTRLGADIRPASSGTPTSAAYAQTVSLTTSTVDFVNPRAVQIDSAPVENAGFSTTSRPPMLDE